MKSVRRFLIVSVLGIISAGTLVSSYLAYRFAEHEIEEVYDANLVQYARILSGLLSSDSTTDVQALEQALRTPTELRGLDSDTLERRIESEPELLNTIGHWYERNFAFQLWSSAGT